MRKIILILAAALALPACNDYLTVKPTDALFFDEVQACKQNLASWLTNYRNSSASGTGDAPQPWLPLLTGAKYQAYADVWSFRGWISEAPTEQQKRLVGRTVINEEDWARYYAIIGRMNLVINEVTEAQGDADMRNYVLGEALMHRAFCLLKLLQYYGHQTNAALGVPVYTATQEGFDTGKLQRKSHQQVFDQIFADLAQVENLLKQTPPRKSYNVMYNESQLWRIAAQAWFWKAGGPAAATADWAQAAAASQKSIELAGVTLPASVTDLNTNYFGNNTFLIQSPQFDMASKVGDANFMGFPETLLYKFDGGNYSYVNYGYDFDLWKALYADNDVRKKSWFLDSWIYPETATEADLNPTRKFTGFWPTMFKPTLWFRLGEQWLIMTEALAHTNIAQAQTALRQWQSTRYSGAETEWPTVPGTLDELLAEIHRERKREFVMEGDLLWLDMKRLNIAEEARTAGGYTAPAMTVGDTRYQFMIPDSETNSNTTITPNPGWGDYRTIQ